LGPGAVLGIVASALAAGLAAAAVLARKARARSRRRHRQQGRSSAPPGPDDGEYDENDEAPCLGSGRPARSDDAAPPPKPSAGAVSMLWPPHPSEADAAPDFRPRRAAALASSVDRLGEI
jgi:hypothetical protein